MNKVDVSLYGIVDPNRSKGRSLSELAKISAENGATLIQYRDKQNDIRTMIENAKLIKQSLKEITSKQLRTTIFSEQFKRNKQA